MFESRPFCHRNGNSSAGSRQAFARHCALWHFRGIRPAVVCLEPQGKASFRSESHNQDLFFLMAVGGGVAPPAPSPARGGGAAKPERPPSGKGGRGWALIG